MPIARDHDRGDPDTPEPKRTISPVFDADRHVVEPGNIWTGYLSRSFQEAARAALCFVDEDTFTLNGRTASREKVFPARAAPPNSDLEAAKQITAMDASKVDVALLFPTLFLEGLHLVQDGDVVEAVARGYNEWIDDQTSPYRDRLLPVGVLPLQAVDAAVQEIRRLASRGFRAVLIPPTFVAEHYVTTAHFDRVWQTLAAEGLVACVHPPIASLDRRPTSYAPITASVGESLGLEDGVGRTIGPAMDCGAFLMTFMARGLFEKFPDLRVAFCHSGSAWLPLALDKTETAMWLCNQRDPVSLEPAQVFNNRDNLVTFTAHDGSVQRMPDLFARLGAWGSREPYPDRTRPDDARQTLEAAKVQKIVIGQLLGGNAARVFGVNVTSGG